MKPCREFGPLAATLLEEGILGGLTGVLCGVSSAVFLLLLEAATLRQMQFPWLLWLLPLSGFLIGCIYHYYGSSVVSGNNLLLEHLHDRKSAVLIPFRMAPLVLFGTVATHLFGGSDGREGTAVQMGGAFSSLLIQLFRPGRRRRRLLMMGGVSGGFGAVFGTPLAGAVFGMEVVTIGQVRYEGIFCCLIASFVGDAICRLLGVHHLMYTVGVVPALTAAVWGWIALAAIIFALAALVFIELTERISHLAARFIAFPPLRPVLGGMLVILLTLAVGSRDYLGLSLPLLQRAFTVEGVVFSVFALKILFTAVTLGTGFKGGEVTPLFVIGGTLGSAVAQLTHQPTGFFAALGFIGVFSGAANTPLTCIFMGIELFGAQIALPAAAVCVITYILSGHRGIYNAQRIGVSKAGNLHFRRHTSLHQAKARCAHTVQGRGTKK